MNIASAVISLKVVVNKSKYMPEKIIEGYCVKCHQKKEMVSPAEVEMKGKGGSVRKAVTGNCPVCSTKMFRILPKEKESPDIAKEIGDFDKESQLK